MAPRPSKNTVSKQELSPAPQVAMNVAACRASPKRKTQWHVRNGYGSSRVSGLRHRRCTEYAYGLCKAALHGQRSPPPQGERITPRSCCCCSCTCCCCSCTCAIAREQLSRTHHPRRVAHKPDVSQTQRANEQRMPLYSCVRACRCIQQHTHQAVINTASCRIARSGCAGVEQALRCAEHHLSAKQQ